MLKIKEENLCMFYDSLCMKGQTPDTCGAAILISCHHVITFIKLIILLEIYDF